MSNKLSSTQLRTGTYWLSKLRDALVPVVTFQAIDLYGQVPDVDDRISDALAALVEGSERFNPKPGKDGIGYYLRFTLAHVAGALRNGAQVAKDWSNEAACFTDIAPDTLGIERLFETISDDADVTDENQFVLNNGKVASTLEIVELIASHDERRRIAAKILGVQADDPDLRVRLLETLDTIAAELRAEPAWTREVPEPAPVVTHDLEAVTVIRNGVQTEISAEDVEQMVEAASRKAALWTPEEDGVQFETDVPWASWREEERDRAYRSAYADDSAWPKTVSPLWRDLLASWLSAGVASDVLDPLMGFETEIPETAQWAVEEMERLSDALAGETEGSVKTVARALAYRLAKMGVDIEREDGQLPAEALFEALCWTLGVDGTRGWDAEQPSADALKDAVADWVERAVTQKGVWPSQAAAIKALVLHRATPRAAKAAGDAAYAASR